MKRKELVRLLNQKYNVLVRTEYHLQIETTVGFHNIWINRRGELKLKLAGNRKVYDCVTPEEILERISKYDTDLNMMKELSVWIEELKGKEGIFVDAGFKDGKAKFAVIDLKQNGDCDISIRSIIMRVASSLDAEIIACEYGIRMYPDRTIHTDCMEAAKRTGATWIPRSANKEADHFGNMRIYDGNTPVQKNPSSSKGPSVE